MSTWSKSISHWGPGGTSGAHTTVGVAVGALASTWPRSRRSFSTAYSSYLVYRNPAIWLGDYRLTAAYLFGICHLCTICLSVCLLLHCTMSVVCL